MMKNKPLKKFWRERVGILIVRKKIVQKQSIEFLDGGWKFFALRMIKYLIGVDRQEQVKKVINLLLTQFSGNKEVFASAGLVTYHKNQ
jgi:hypothetical protein